MKIEQCIGEVDEIHFTKQAFDAIELSIFMNINVGCNLHITIGLKEGPKVYNFHIHEIRSAKGENDLLSEDEYSSNDSKNTSVPDIHLHNPVNVRIESEVHTLDNQTPEFVNGQTPILSSGSHRTKTDKTPLLLVHYDNDSDSEELEEAPDDSDSNIDIRDTLVNNTMESRESQDQNVEAEPHSPDNTVQFQVGMFDTREEENNGILESLTPLITCKCY